MKTYFINFFLWWYLLNGKKVYINLVGKWLYTLEALNVIPMLTNLFRPLFQDQSWEGKLIAVPFRLIWVILGSSFQLVYAIILAIFFSIYLFLPLAPGGIIIWNLIK